MKKFLILPLALLLMWQQSLAQSTPKLVEKAKRAVFSIVTYDAADHILNSGNGFFVSEDGVALSDYTLFKGAKRAVVITADGKEMPVSTILGADGMYDVIKFRVGLTVKKVPALPVATLAPAVGSEVWMLPYSTQKSAACESGKVKAVSKMAGEHHYYTLGMTMKDKMVSCPVVDAEGKVFGIAQKSSGMDSVSTCYAAGASFAMAQKISALSLSDATLRSIGIRKGLPDTEDQALVYLMMASTQLSLADYGTLLDDFIAQFPQSTEGRFRRASYYMARSKEDASYLERSEAELKEALEIAVKKDDAHYNIAKHIYAYQLTKPETTYKDWTLDTALKHLQEAYALNPLDVYTQLEADIQFAKKDYPAAAASYAKVNASKLASPASFFNEAKTRELMKADSKEVLALMDSCVARCPDPLTPSFAPYVLERAQMRMEANQARLALVDYDSYAKAMHGNVNDLFYYYREQAALKSRQYQRALDDIAQAIAKNPKELLYRAELVALNLRVGRAEEALNQMEALLKENPKYAEGYRLRGLCKIQLKKKAEAMEDFRKAKELGDPNVDVLLEKYGK